MKVKGLSLRCHKFRGKRVPESRNRGANVKSDRAPFRTQKSARKNPNLTGKAKVIQIWFRPRLLLYFVRCSAPI